MTDQAAPNALLGYDHTGGDQWPAWLRHLVPYLGATAPGGDRIDALVALADKTSDTGFFGSNRAPAFERMRLRHLARCISRAHAMGGSAAFVGGNTTTDPLRKDVLSLCERSFNALRKGHDLAPFNALAVRQYVVVGEWRQKYPMRDGFDPWRADAGALSILDRIVMVVRHATHANYPISPLGAAQETMGLAGLVLGFANDEARRNAEQAEALTLLRGLSDDRVSLEATND